MHCPLCHEDIGSEDALQFHYLLSCPAYSVSAEEPQDSQDSTVLVRFRWAKARPCIEHQIHLISSLAGSVTLRWNETEALYESALICVPTGQHTCQLAAGDNVLPTEDFVVTEDSDVIYVITADDDAPNDPVDPITDHLGFSARESRVGRGTLPDTDHPEPQSDEFKDLSLEYTETSQTEESNPIELSPLYKELLQHQVLHGEPSWIPTSGSQSPVTSDPDLEALLAETASEEVPPFLITQPAHLEELRRTSPVPIRPGFGMVEVKNQPEQSHGSEDTATGRAEQAKQRVIHKKERHASQSGSSSSSSSSNSRRSSRSSSGSKHSSRRESPRSSPSEHGDTISEGSIPLQEQSLEESIPVEFTGPPGTEPSNGPVLTTSPPDETHSHQSTVYESITAQSPAIPEDIQPSSRASPLGSAQDEVHMTGQMPLESLDKRTSLAEVRVSGFPPERRAHSLERIRPVGSVETSNHGNPTLASGVQPRAPGCEPFGSGVDNLFDPTVPTTAHSAAGYGSYPGSGSGTFADCKSGRNSAGAIHSTFDPTVPTTAHSAAGYGSYPGSSYGTFADCKSGRNSAGAISPVGSTHFSHQPTFDPTVPTTAHSAAGYRNYPGSVYDTIGSDIRPDSREIASGSLHYRSKHSSGDQSPVIPVHSASKPSSLRGQSPVRSAHSDGRNSPGSTRAISPVGSTHSSHHSRHSADIHPPEGSVHSSGRNSAGAISPVESTHSSDHSRHSAVIQPPKGSVHSSGRNSAGAISPVGSTYPKRPADTHIPEGSVHSSRRNSTGTISPVESTHSSHHSRHSAVIQPPKESVHSSGRNSAGAISPVGSTHPKRPADTHTPEGSVHSSGMSSAGAISPVESTHSSHHSRHSAIIQPPEGSVHSSGRNSAGSLVDSIHSRGKQDPSPPGSVHTGGISPHGSVVQSEVSNHSNKRSTRPVSSHGSSRRSSGEKSPPESLPSQHGIQSISINDTRSRKSSGSARPEEHVGSKRSSRQSPRSSIKNGDHTPSPLSHRSASPPREAHSIPSFSSAFQALNGDRGPFHLGPSPEVEALRQERDTLARELKQRTAHYEAEVQRLQAHNEDLSQQLLSVQTAAALSEQDNQKLKGLERMASTLNQSLGERETEISQLQEQVEELEKLNKEMKDEEASLKTVNELTVEDLSKANEDLKAEITGMRRRSVDSSSHRSYLSSDDTNSETRKLNKSLMDKIERLETEKRELKHKYNQTKLELDKTKAEKSISDFKLSKAKSEEADLMDKFNRYTSYQRTKLTMDLSKSAPISPKSSGLGSSWSDTHHDTAYKVGSYNPSMVNGSVSPSRPNTSFMDRTARDYGVPKPGTPNARRRLPGSLGDESDLSDASDLDIYRTGHNRHRTFSSESSTSSTLDYDYGLNTRHAEPATYRPAVYVTPGDSKVQLRETGKGRRAQRPHSYRAGMGSLTNIYGTTDRANYHQKSATHSPTRRVDFESSLSSSDSSFATTPRKTTRTVTSPGPYYSKPFAPRSARDVELGMRVLVTRTRGNVGRGVVKYVGALPGRPDTYVGVELESADGKHDGSFDGHRFFKCTPKRGIFVCFNKVVMCYG